MPEEGTLFHHSGLQVPDCDRVLALHADCDEIGLFKEGHGLDALLVARQSSEQFALFHVVEVGKRCSGGILAALTSGNQLSLLRNSHARELDLGVSEHRLLPCFSLFDDQLVVQGEVGEAILYVPVQVVVDTSESIVAVNQFVLEVRLALISEAQETD